MKRLRVLISSHEFSPAQGSECAVGWNIATRLAAHLDVTLLCADGAPGHPDSYRKPVLAHFSQHGPSPGLRVIHVPQPPLTRGCAAFNRRLVLLTRGIGWQIFYYLGLKAWHRATYRTAVALGWERFDLVHQLTPISCVCPGFLADSPLPFFWGPVGGMFRVPTAFTRLGGSMSHWFEALRVFNISRTCRSARFRELVRRAAHIWTITDAEKQVIDALAPGKAEVMIDSAPPAGVNGKIHYYDNQRPLALCWSGQHAVIKALPLLLEALSSLPEPRRVQLTVIGEGPETAVWKDLATRLGLVNVNWCGRLPYVEALDVMGQADVFVHSSYREAASMVVLEALGCGLPVICHDACGMAVAVNDMCGIKVPFVDPAHSVTGFREAILDLLRQPSRVEQLSAGALRRAEELSWEAKVRQMVEAYFRHVAAD
jgi:glycosyltransferase involved in cell wall biosynthesis